jgi:hypothetical protein
MDPNRNSRESCQNQIDECKQAYSDYHNFITTNFENNFMINGAKKYEQGLLIDLHGQGLK